MAKSDDKDTVRKIWLAGIGAYGRALTEAKGAVDSLTGKSSEVFDELVQKGEILEAVGKYKASELVGKGKAAVPDIDIDDRIAKMRERLSGVGATIGSGIGAGKLTGEDERLSARVDVLEAKLDAILDKLDIGDAAPKKRAAPKAKPASKKKMTTQKKTAPKKPATKKTTTKKAPKSG